MNAWPSRRARASSMFAIKVLALSAALASAMGADYCNGISACSCTLLEASNATLKIDKLYRNCTECVLSHCTRNVQRMYLHGQEIQDIKKMAFYGMNGVKELHLTNNSLTRLEKGTFDGLTKLEYLYISENNIEYVEKGTFDRRYLPNLRHISIGGNPIELWHHNVTF